MLALAREAVFPRVCVACGAYGAAVCATCAQNVGEVPQVEEGEDRVALCTYANPVARRALLAAKYRGDREALAALVELGRPRFSLLHELVKRGEQPCAVIPLPLAARRLRERGFNQASILARAAAAELGLPVLHALTRRDRLGHQAARSKEERAHAMSHTPFVCTAEIPSSVLLVDDVWTTGATARAAAATLHAAGARRVAVVTWLAGDL